MLNESTYLKKLKTTTTYRLIAFMLWKFIIGMIIYWLFTYISGTRIILYFTKYKFNFNLLNYIWIYFFSLGVDYLKLVVYQNYEDYASYIEQTVKIILEPSFSTIFMFINSIFILAIMNTIQGKEGGNSRNRYITYINKLGITMIFITC